MPIVSACRQVNYRQRECVVERLLAHLKILKERAIGVMVIALKPNTDDIRDSPGLDIAHRLAQRGANVRLHDPVALDRARAEAGTTPLHFCDSPEQVACGADALVAVTDWPDYRELDWEAIAGTMRNRLILDGRNFLPAERMERAGFQYLGI